MTSQIPRGAPARCLAEQRGVRSPRSRMGCLLLALSCAAAGCASNEPELRHEVKSLRYDLNAAKQRNEDLRHRMRLAEARNRVLIRLVQGLTAAAEQPAYTNAVPAVLGPAHESLVAIDRELEGLAETLHKSRNDMDALRNQRAALQQELTSTTRAIEHARAHEAAANARVLAFRELLLRFRATTEASGLKVKLSGNRMLLQLPDGLLFERGSAVVKRDGRALLDQVATAMIAVGEREFQITGHSATGAADQGGGYESEWQLSAARAINVTRYLIKRGVPKHRLSAAAFADTQPITATNPAESERRSRRIEIALVPRLNEQPEPAVLDALLAEDVTTSEEAAAEPEDQPASPAEAPAAEPSAPPALPETQSPAGDPPPAIAP